MRIDPEIFAGLVTVTGSRINGNSTTTFLALDSGSGSSLNYASCSIQIDSAKLTLLPGAADGASALGVTVRTSTSWVNATSKLMNWVNNGSEKAGIYAPQGTFFSLAASTNDAYQLLDGAHLNLSTADSNAYLYRSATDTITTPGTFTAVGKILTTAGLGVGNSAAASSLGSVVKKMQVFDASGASLGFIAIYNAIT